METVERQSLTKNEVSSFCLLRIGSTTAKFPLYLFMSLRTLFLTEQGFQNACHPPLTTNTMINVALNSCVSDVT